MHKGSDGLKSVLIVSSSEKTGELLEEMLTLNSYSDITTAKSGIEARRLLIDRQFDLCIVSTPLQDEFGTEFAINIAQKSAMQVMLLVKSQLADEVSAKVEDYGIFVLSKPISRQLFWSALKLASAAQNRLMGLQSENRQLQKKIEDIRCIDRAKCLLIENFKVTEAEAHRFIEKQAMDMRITKREVAAAILNKFEN